MLTERRRPRGRAAAGERRRPHVVRWLVLAVLLVWLLACAYVGRKAVQQLDAGVADTSVAQSTITPATATHPETLATLSRLHAEFAAAKSDLDSPVWTPIRILPVLGRQFLAVRALATAAATVAGIGHDSVAKAQSALKAPRATGPERLAAARTLADAATAADQGLRTVDLGPRTGLVGLVRSKHNEFATKLARIDAGVHRGAVAAQGVADLLAGQHRLLVLAANNGEMRDGSGMFLSVTAIGINDGALTVGGFSDSAQLRLPATAVPVSAGEVGPWGFLTPNQEWRNLGLSARFDATAALASRMWAAKTGETVTDVMAVDISALSLLVRASNPVTVGGRTFDADGLVTYLLHDQYLTADQSVQANAARRDALGGIAQAVMGSLEAGHYDPAKIASGLSGVVGGRHLMMWSSDPAAEARWDDAGASGKLLADALIVAVQNRGANKLDQYLSVSTVLAIQPGNPSSTSTTVTVNVLLHNGAPAGLPPYIAGDGEVAGLLPGSYLGYVTVTMPAAATDVLVDGRPAADVKGSDGPTRVVAAVRTVPQGGSINTTVSFVLPVLHGHLQISSAGRIPAATYRLTGPNPSLPIADDERPRIEW